MSLKLMINFLNILKVGYKTRKKKLKIKKKYIPLNLLIFLYKKGIIDTWTFENNYLNITLRYLNNKPIFNNIKFISTAGHRVYLKKQQNLKYYKDNIEIILITSKGFMTNKEAAEVGIGGEVFIIIYY